MSKILKKITIILIVIAGISPAKAQEYNFEDYVYPFGFRTYVLPDSDGNLSSVTQYSFESQTFDNYLIEEVIYRHRDDVSKNYLSVSC